MADKITKIASSYDMVSIMRDIGANYFGSDLSEQRIGMFGYLTESAANMFGAAILDASNRQQEYNTCTAKKRSTLLYDGAKLNVNIDNATPSRMTAYVGVLTNTITSPSHKGGYGKPIEGTANRPNPDYLLVIEKDSIINIANYNFTTEYDIQIKATYNQSTESYSYSVSYLLEGDKDVTSLNEKEYIVSKYNTAYPIADKYIQSYVKNYNKNISILLFKVNLVQVTKESTTYPVVKNDIISLTGLDFPFNNQLSHFNIFYRKNVNSSWENIKAVPIYQSDVIYDEEVIFYETFHDEKKIRLMMTDFIPAYNSEIRIDIYNTMGSEVNDLIYTGDGSDIYITLNSVDERHVYTGLELNCMPISSAYGATDTPTLEELRSKIIIAKSTVNSMDTDYDFINFMKTRDTTNDYVFVKKRNDIIERRYSCFMIPRLIKKDIIPTSTLDLCIPNFRSNIDTEKYTYYNFNKVSNYENYSGPLFYTDGNTYKGSMLDTIDDKGENDEGTEFYSISKSTYKDLLNVNIDSILINDTYIYPSNDRYNKSDQYVTLRSYLNINNTTLKSIVDREFNNPLSNIKNDSSITKFSIDTNQYANYKSKLYYDLENYIYVDSSKIDKDIENNILNKYKLKKEICNIMESSEGLYIHDINDNDLYFNLLNEYNNDFYIAIDDSNGDYYYNSNNFVYEKITDLNYTGDRYKIISINDPNYSDYINLEYTVDTNGEYVTSSIKYDDNVNSYDHTILIKNIDETYSSPYDSPEYKGRQRYSIIYNEIEYTDFSKNNCGYIYPDSGNRKLIIQLHNTINYDKTEYIDYIFNEIENYYAHENSDGDYLYMNTNTNSDGSNNIAYYYKYKDMVTIKDIPLYIANKIDSEYLRDIENKCLYYVQNSIDNNIFIKANLYYRDIKNTKGDIGSYIYDKNTKSYIKQIDDYSINGVTYTVDDNGNKENITIKSGTPLILKKDIENNSSNGRIIKIDYKRYRKDDENYIEDTDGGYICYNGNYKTIYTSFNGHTTALVGGGGKLRAVLDNNDCISMKYLSNIMNTPYISEPDFVYSMAGLTTKELKNRFGISVKYFINEKYVPIETYDTDFDIDNPSYKYPILGIDDFYNKNNYSEDGKEFNINNSLIILNTYEQVLKSSSNNTKIPKYTIDQNKGLYWSKNGTDLESVMKVYSLPYTIIYNVKNQIASFFLTSISRDINMNMIEEETKNTPVNFAIDTIHIKRNSAIEEDSVYNITATIMANGDTSKAKFSKNVDDGTIVEYNTGSVAGSIMLKGFIYNDNDELMGYFDLDYDTSISNSIDDMFTFTGKIKINGTISSSSSKYFTNMKNMYSIKNLSYNGYTEYIEGNKILYIPDNIEPDDEYLNLRIQKLRIGIGCYYLNRSVDMNTVISIDSDSMKIKPIVDNNNEHTVLLSPVGQGTLSYPQFISTITYNTTEGVKQVNDKYILTNVYDNSIDLVDIYTDMSNFVKSSVQINEIIVSDQNSQTLEMIHFTDVPVIQFSQCLSDTMADRITNIITDASYHLSDLSKQITNNFSIDYKFFRTYGPCRYFNLRSIAENGGYNDIKLGDLDIKIKFNLLIKTNLNISDSDVVSQLKSYIKTRIEELNNETDNDDYTIYISNIITDIENEFNDYVRSIELISINNNSNSYRVINYNKPNFNNIDYYNSDITSTDIKEYIPEYINVPLNNITIEVRR